MKNILSISLEMLQFRIQSVRRSIEDGKAENSHHIDMWLDGVYHQCSVSNFRIDEAGNIFIATDIKGFRHEI